VTGSTGYRVTTSPQVKRDCPAGYYITDNNHVACTRCPGSYYCPDGIHAYLCDWSVNGYFYITTDGATACTHMPTGLISLSDARLVTGVKRCAEGQRYYDENSCDTASARYYTPDPTINYEPLCPDGEYTPTSGYTTCIKCTQGNYCQNGYQYGLGSGYYSTNYINLADCPAGYYCPNRHLAIQCPAGYYSGIRATICSPSSVGWVSYGSGQSRCNDYHYTFGGEVSCRTPERGWGLVTANSYSTIQYCPPGYGSDGNSLCNSCGAGWYCPIGWSWYSCPAGFYCPATNGWPILADAGTYAAAGAGSQPGCYYNNQWSLYGSAGCSTRNLISGYYQKDRTSYLKAARGGYAVDTGTWNSWNENACTEPNYCTYGLSKTCPDNLRTTYLTGEKVACTSVTYGKAWYSGNNLKDCYNVTRSSLQGHTDCFQCNENEDCMYRNQYFMFRNSVDDQLVCQRGKYSNIGDLICSEDKVINNLCPFGFYGYVDPLDAAKVPAEKPILCKHYDFFSGTNTVLKSIVTTCHTGTYTMKNFDDCLVGPPGFLMAQDNTQTYDPADQCPNGFYCGINFDHTASLYSQNTVRCPYGTFARDGFTGGKSEADTCALCPPGFYCPGDSKKYTCTTSYICDIGTTWPIVTCPEGFYYDTTVTDITTYPRCKQCPEGKFCPYKATTADIQDCPSGYTCGAGSFIGTTAPSKPGYYIPTGGSETLCSQGKYCPESATQEYNCPVFFRLLL